MHKKKIIANILELTKLNNQINSAIDEIEFKKWLKLNKFVLIDRKNKIYIKEYRPNDFFFVHLIGDGLCTAGITDEKFAWDNGGLQSYSDAVAYFDKIGIA